ncbi:GATA-type zinc finger protein 1 [Cyanocitta cristata]
MGEQPVFLRGEPPDFSLLRRLLCLEPERLLLTPGGAATTEARRTGLPEPPPRPRSPPSVPGESLGFLQEAVRLLSPPAPLSVPPAALPEHPEVSAVPTGSPDTLSLIDLQCQLLAGGTGSDNGTSTGTGSGTGSGRRRKRARPQRGADPRDPSFRGVTLRMRLALPRGDTGDCRLLVTARAHRIPTWSRGSGSSDEDAPVRRGRKRCTSCKTRRTPLWRTAEDGTVLCNACGIRYRKYRVRCQRCWNIPGKSGTPQCPRCPTRPAGTGGDSEDATAAG